MKNHTEQSGKSSRGLIDATPSAVVQLVELIKLDCNPDKAPEDDSMLVMLSGDQVSNRQAFAKLWAMVIIMSIRDKATSIHYHPWKGDDALSYVIDKQRYIIVPPPAEYADECIDVARSMFIRPRREGFFWWLRRRSSAASSPVRCECPGWATLWDAVVWSSGPRAGVELFLISEPFLIESAPGKSK